MIRWPGVQIRVMLKDPIEAALNDQITAELSSEYVYLSMAAYFEDSGVPGFASWMRDRRRRSTPTRCVSTTTSTSGTGG